MRRTPHLIRRLHATCCMHWGAHDHDVHRRATPSYASITHPFAPHARAGAAMPPVRVEKWTDRHMAFITKHRSADNFLSLGETLVLMKMAKEFKNDKFIENLGYPAMQAKLLRDFWPAAQVHARPPHFPTPSLPQRERPPPTSHAQTLAEMSPVTRPPSRRSRASLRAASGTAAAGHPCSWSSTFPSSLMHSRRR
jgi:hypothetical protein